jgi:hypothetical protein
VSNSTALTVTPPLLSGTDRLLLTYTVCPHELWKSLARVYISLLGPGPCKPLEDVSVFVSMRGIPKAERSSTCSTHPGPI